MVCAVVLPVEVKLTIVDLNGCLEIWDRFATVIKAKVAVQHEPHKYDMAMYRTLTIACLEEELSKFGAWLDPLQWTDQYNPITEFWFPDEESRALFILTWS